MKLCDYGCGKESKYQISSNKWCCEDNFRKCRNFIEKRIKKVTGSKQRKPILFENENNILCSYCLSKKAKYQLKNGKFCCENATSKCDELKRKNKEANLGSKNGFFNKHHSEKSLEKMRVSHLGVKKGPHTELHKKRISESWTVERREEKRQYMINGGTKYVCSFIKKISNEELKLREMVQQIYSDCKFQHTILKYFLDVAIVDHKIAIEYDGYFHFSCKENIEYHKNRQEKIEKEGWKFYRVTMFDKFPTLQEVKENIQRIINND